MSDSKLLQKMREQFWRIHAPLIALSAVIGWLVWYAVFGNSWLTWAASTVPIFGGIAHIYPRSTR